MNPENPRTAPVRESRREDRLARHIHFDGELALRPGDAATDLPVTALRNVSANGASVLLQRGLPEGSAVSVVLYTGGVRMEFIGNVAWCRVAGEDDVLDNNRPAHGAMYAVGLHILAPGSFAAMITAHETHTRPAVA